MPRSTPHAGKIALRNVNHPGRDTLVDARKYKAMRRAFLKVLPKKSPGLTVAQVQKRVIAPQTAVSRRRQGGLVDQSRSARSGGEGRRQARADQAAPSAEGLTSRLLEVRRILM